MVRPSLAYLASQRVMAETRATVRRRLRKAGAVPTSSLETRLSSQRAAPLQTQLARVTQLLAAARLEVAALLPSDSTLRRAILTDLEAMLKKLRSTSVQAAESMLPDMKRR